MSLLESTKALLRARPKGLTLQEIADASEGRFGRDWLNQFVNGRISDPSVNRVEALRDLLIKLHKKRPF